MQSVQHQMMGYDRAITMFSPDGRLLQVEYAKKTVRQGSTAIGIVCSDGVVLVADKRIVDKLVVAESIEKVWQIDDHIASTAAGILSDARVLVERAQVRAQQHKVTYDTPIDIITIVKDACDIKQICTQSGGLRPFGVSLLIAGIDTEPKLFETDPTGLFFRYKATAIGEGEQEVEKVLQAEYKASITVEEALNLAVKSLFKIFGDKLTTDRLDGAYVLTKDRKYNKISLNKFEKILSELKKQKPKKEQQ